MPEPLRWEFSLLDKLSSPAEQMAKSVSAASDALKKARPALDQVDKALAKATVEELKAAVATKNLAKEIDALTKQLQPAKRLTVEMGNMFHSFAGFRREADGRWVFNLADGLSTVADVVSRLVGGFSSLVSKGVEVAAAGEKTKRAFNLNLGGREGGELASYLGNVADASRGLHTRAQLAELINPLQQHGIKSDRIQNYLAASLSVEQRGLPASGAIGAFDKLRTGHAIDVGTLESLGFGSEGDQRELSRKIAKAVGLGFSNIMSPDEILGNVSARLARPQFRGKVDKVENLLLLALQGREGGVLGKQGAEGQETPAATLQRLQNLPQTIAERLAASGALGSLMASLNRFVDTLTGPSGKQFIDGLGRIVDKFASLIDRIAGIIGDQDEIDRASGVSKRANLGGGRSILYDEKDIDEAAKRARPPTLFEKLFEARVDVDRRRGLEQIERETGPGGANRGPLGPTPAQSTAEQQDFGFNLAAGMDRFEASKSVNPPALPRANDMVWRGGEGVEIDPADTLVAFKRGGSLGLGGPGGGMALNIAEGAIVVHGGGASPEHIAKEVMRQITEEGAAQLMLSQLDQMAAEQGA